jgi:hypothetical protein
VNTWRAYAPSRITLIRRRLAAVHITLTSHTARGELVQGQLATALKYLCMLPGEDTPPTAVLRDRIYRSGLVPAASLQPPPFPFVAEEVASPGGGVKPAVAAKPAQQQQQAQRAAAAQPVQQQYQQYGQQQSQQQRPAYPQPMVPTPAYPVAPAAPQSMYSPQPVAMAHSTMAAPAPTSYMPQQPQQHAAYQPQPTPAGYAPAAANAAAAAYQAQPSHQSAVAAAPAPPPPAAGYAPAAAPVTATFQPQSFQPQPMMVPPAAAAYPAAQQQAQFMAPGMPQQPHAMAGMPGMTQPQQQPAAPEPAVRISRLFEWQAACAALGGLGEAHRVKVGRACKRDVKISTTV